CFFFQAEDGIRDRTVTGVQTCALPIFAAPNRSPAVAAQKAASAGSSDRAQERPITQTAAEDQSVPAAARRSTTARNVDRPVITQIGRASCRERVEIRVEAVCVEKNKRR